MEVLSSFVMTLGHCIESSDTTDSHCVAVRTGAYRKLPTRHVAFLCCLQLELVDRS